MSSRDKILNAIKVGKPPLTSLPVIQEFIKDEDILALFTQTLSNIGAQVALTDSYESVQNFYKEEKEKGVRVIQDLVQFLTDPEADYTSIDARALEDIDTVMLRGSLGVAENGAIWVSERDMPNRLLPFICQHLVLVVSANDLVSTMHDAYKKIRINEDGYGVFIAGPSKTADIEQSLVVGAHGPLSLRVFIIQG